MKPHTKIYIEFFDYPPHADTWIPCEQCEREKAEERAVDVHHLSARGMGGSISKDHIENLIGLCRKHHLMAEHNRHFNATVNLTHSWFIKKHRPDYKFASSIQSFSS